MKIKVTLSKREQKVKNAISWPFKMVGSGVRVSRNWLASVIACN